MWPILVIKMFRFFPAGVVLDINQNILASHARVTQIFVITVKGFDSAIIFIRDQYATTGPARHMLKTGSLNCPLIRTSVIYQTP